MYYRVYYYRPEYNNVKGESELKIVGTTIINDALTHEHRSPLFTKAFKHAPNKESRGATKIKLERL